MKEREMNQDVKADEKGRPHVKLIRMPTTEERLADLEKRLAALEKKSK